MINKLLCLITLSVSTLAWSNLSAEVEEVRLRFKPGMCDRGCVDLLHRNLQKIRGAEDVYVSPDGVEAVVKWEPGKRFSWAPFNTATRIVGLRIHETWIRVSGEIRARGRDLVIISEGDGTPFALLGPIQPQADRYVISKNPENRQLSSRAQDELLQRSRDGELAIISGPLFMPWRGQRPLFLVLEGINWERGDDNNDNNRRRPQRRQ